MLRRPAIDVQISQDRIEGHVRDLMVVAAQENAIVPASVDSRQDVVEPLVR
jgi:hypothetical protein